MGKDTQRLIKRLLFGCVAAAVVSATPARADWLFVGDDGSSGALHPNL